MGFSPGFRSLEYVTPHVVADFAVELADAVAERGETQGQHGQAERLIRLTGEGETQIDEFVGLNAQFVAAMFEVFADRERYRTLRCQPAPGYGW